MKYLLAVIMLLLITLQGRAQAWNSVCGGADQSISSLYVDSANGLLYATGNFDTIGGIVAHKVAIWNGSAWKSLGTGIGFHGLSVVQYHNDIYVSGFSNRVKKWDGVSWTTLPLFDENVYVLKVIKDTLYAGGGFINAGGKAVHGIAKWDGTKWQPVGDGKGVRDCAGCPGNVLDIELFQDTIYIAGLFDRASDSLVMNVAKWDGMEWKSLKGGLPGSSQYAGWVNDLFSYNGKLYVGGNFIKAGGNPANRIANWDGTKWDSIGHGFSYEVSNINVCKGKLVAAGSFDHSGVKPINSLAIWNDTTWEPFSSNQLYGNLYSSAHFNNEFYVSGAWVIDINGKPEKHIARWSQVDIDTPKALLCFDDCNYSLTATPVGLKPYTYKWNTSPVQTTQTATALCAGIYTVTVTDSTGSTSTGSITIDSLPRIIFTDTSKNASCNSCANGSAGVTVLSGVSPFTYLWSTGDTTDSIINQLPGIYTVVITDSVGCQAFDTLSISFNTAIEASLSSSLSNLSLYPNPTTSQLTVTSNQLADAEIELRDLYGRLVKQIKTSLSPTVIDVKPLKNGVFFLYLKTSEGTVVRKFVKE